MIKYVAGLLLGIALGVLVAAALLYFNPLAARNPLSPLSVSKNNILSLGYSGVPTDSIVYTNNGESRVQPHPEKVRELWEAPIRRSEVLLTVLTDSRNNPAGIGIKFSSESERTRLINGEALVDSAWHIHLVERGSLFVEQTENYWNFLRKIVLPAYWSSANHWKGVWNGNMTVGPGALGTAAVTGGTGEFAGLVSEAVEAINASAYSVAQGPVAMEGRLIIDVTGNVELTSRDVAER
ncbi:MAG: hypothetical protein OEQ30_02270 [Gammaproteobacteria bacterium]|nr:hypothetical protein [Gammaproteobacteria bacterium]MDH3757199.1 hypothetical protein [Gammaproteobacteria bacterium]MDH3849304.1 hypothetical protein [Gammaproteobacteria bacterium]MDH3863244.1 hypothetical protein [Gammaproteobacteria bacterium]MDH3905024.1 hypothetical protein [Gammaproteobacteria bacterium]